MCHGNDLQLAGNWSNLNTRENTSVVDFRFTEILKYSAPIYFIYLRIGSDFLAARI